MIPGDLVADNTFFSAAAAIRCDCLHGYIAAQAISRCGRDFEGAGLVGGLHHSNQLTGTGIAGQALIGGVIRLAAIVHADDLAVSFDGELDGHVIGVDEISLLILHADGDIAEVIAIGSDGSTVSLHGELGGICGGFHIAAAFSLGDGCSINLECLYLQLACLVGHPEGGVKALVAGLLVKIFSSRCPGAVSITLICSIQCRGRCAHLISIEIELNDGCVRVYHHFHIIVGSEDDVASIPSRKQV